MSRRRLSLAIACCASLALLATGAEGAVVAVNGIVIHADGGFQPRTLPRRAFAPIDFTGRLTIAGRGGGAPPPLQEAVLEFDRDGRLDVTGLPQCAPETVATMSPQEARSACRGAIVGKGRIEAEIPLLGLALRESSPLTVFNGPPLNGSPTAILHARTSLPSVQTFAIVVPIEREAGPFRYRATATIPSIADGLGAITRIQLKIGRHFEAEGRSRSYISARCSDNVLQTHGRFTFADGTIIDGAVEKPCTVR